MQPVGSAAPASPLPLAPEGDGWVLTVPGLPDGLYRVRVKTVSQGPGAPVPVEDVFEVARQA